MPLRMSGAWRFTLTIGFCLMVLGYRGEAWAQQPFAYPSQGQSTEQQAADNSECNQWAVGQSGFDPWRAQPYPQTTMLAAPPPPSRPRGGAIRGAAAGAALGAVGGAIAGNAGRGAAIGAATGALAGVMRRRAREREVAEWNQYQQAMMARQQAAFANQQAAGQGTFDRAYSACMTARGYVVQ